MPGECIMKRGAFQRELLVLTRGQAVTVPDHDHQLETATQVCIDLELHRYLV